MNYLVEFNNKRGTCGLNGSGFKGGAAGSDKNMVFRLLRDPALDWVAVFQAPQHQTKSCLLFLLFGFLSPVGLL